MVENWQWQLGFIRWITSSRYKKNSLFLANFHLNWKICLYQLIQKLYKLLRDGVCNPVRQFMLFL
ncbi:hypothetical protein THIOM_003606 [Candidatus Thiomargarita nelsonii]|uniref:Uncharacterized protein n=1 Tax=Candidatus Thiomargarita nelsonii TaxID=1003181 RepID=A0A176RYA6_9GAMM|nr:hypothetical protein THIOM_003606 [Candidatus Thiomargarita nelsonii]